MTISSRPRPARPSNHDEVFEPATNRILVFGSNLAGIHAVGARRYAYNWCGAEWDKGEGLMGSSYAIPTQNKRLRAFSLEEIRKYVEQFIIFAWEHRELEFFVTRLGCDSGEYTDSDIAPLFNDAPPNCGLPRSWNRILAARDAGTGTDAS